MRATLAFLVALALAGCGGGDKPAKPRQLDTAKVEQAIRDSIQTQRNLSARVVCPTGVVQQTGFRFACLAVYKGGSTTFTVDQTDAKGHVTYEGR